MKRNQQYEKEIEACFLEALLQVNQTLSLEDRRRQFTQLFFIVHEKVFRKYTRKIVKDYIVWDHYDGTVWLTYLLPYRADAHQHKFNVPEINYKLK